MVHARSHVLYHESLLYRQPPKCNGAAGRPELKDKDIITAVRFKTIFAASVVVTSMLCTLGRSNAQSPAEDVPVHHVFELTFEGPTFSRVDNPVRDVTLLTRWRHDSGQRYDVHGFWDGPGAADGEGDVFKVRFTPTMPGRWTLTATRSNRSELVGQHEEFAIRAVPSDHPGFWRIDTDRAGGRWYVRSDGSHPYIVGNTMYSFLSEYGPDAPTGGRIESDVERSGRFFNKLRFGITGDRYPHPDVKPFLDHDGRPTDDGDFSHRPNPAWFRERVDAAVRTAFANDVIADLILAGPDTENARATLRADENGGDNTPFLRYMAARYGSYPNVWFCLANEYDIKDPSFEPLEIALFGARLRRFLPYGTTPVSVHAFPGDWDARLNTATPWHDHVILQDKLKDLSMAADVTEKNYWIGGRVPVINDELAYEGAGDGWLESDVLEAMVGAFTGGGYGTTGHKPAGKQGHYFMGRFREEEHRAADNLAWMRAQIDDHISYWRMHPAFFVNGSRLSVFVNLPLTFRALEWAGEEYVLTSGGPAAGVEADLPAGTWRVTLFDVAAMKRTILADAARGELTFDVPDSRASFVHFKRVDR